MSPEFMALCADRTVRWRVNPQLTGRWERWFELPTGDATDPPRLHAGQPRASYAPLAVSVQFLSERTCMNDLAKTTRHLLAQINPLRDNDSDRHEVALHSLLETMLQPTDQPCLLIATSQKGTVRPIHARFNASTLRPRYTVRVVADPGSHDFNFGIGRLPVGELFPLEAAPNAGDATRVFRIAVDLTLDMPASSGHVGGWVEGRAVPEADRHLLRERNLPAMQAHYDPRTGINACANINIARLFCMGDGITYADNVFALVVGLDFAPGTAQPVRRSFTTCSLPLMLYSHMHAWATLFEAGVVAPEART